VLVTSQHNKTTSTLYFFINIDLAKLDSFDKDSSSISQQPTTIISTMAVTDGLAIKIVNIVV
jgi:hypothetical protein